jgi:DNA-binding CsgD family transcriptional regulator
MRHSKNRELASEPTARQREVIQLLAGGRTMKEVAKLLYITPRPVAAHKYTAMELLQVKSNAELIQHAIEHPIFSV